MTQTALKRDPIEMPNEEFISLPTVDVQEVLLELQSLGARLEVPVEQEGRRGGAGPTDDKAFLMAGVAAMVPTLADFAKESPYAVEADDNGGYCVTKNGKSVLPVEFAPSPNYYKLSTEDGIPYSQIAVLHGRDVLATTVSQKCIRWRRDGERCQFCGIENSLNDGHTVALKTPHQLATVAEAATRLDGVRHMVLTTGTMNYLDMGIRYLVKCVTEIKRVVPGIGIQAQFEPPQDLEEMVALKEAGVDTVGIHLESFNQSIRERIAPGKAQIGIERYFETFKRAVEIFGRNQVSTYIIVGLGDTEESILDGCQRAAALGVYPFIVPLRPIIGTPMSEVVAPDPAYMQKIYEQAASINKEHGLNYKNSKAGCTRCGACSGISAFE